MTNDADALRDQKAACPPPLPLRIKVIALIVLVSIVPLTVAAVIDIRDARGRALASASALLSARGEELVGRVDAWNLAYEHAASSLAALHEVVRLCEAGSGEARALEPAARDALEAWTTSDADVRAAAILDLDGRVRIGTEPALAGATLAYHRYVRDALRGRTSISDVHADRRELAGPPTVAYAAPVRAPGDVVVGVAVLWTRANALWSVARASNELAGPGSFAVLLDQEGILIAHTRREDLVFHPGGVLTASSVEALVSEHRFGDATRAILNDVRAFPEPFVRAHAAAPSRDTFTTVAPGDDAPSLAVSRRTEIAPWTVFYMIPEASVEAPIGRMTRDKILFTSAIIALALAGSALLSATFLRRIRALAGATEALGGGDLTARAGDEHADEIGQLAKSFNAMAARLEAQDAALRRARDDLEVRVNERTADLLAEIEERKRAELALRESEVRKAAVMEAALDCIVMMDHRGVVIELNPAAERTFGFSRADAIGKRLGDLIVPPALRERHERGLQRYVETGEGRILGKRLEVTALRADGTEFPAEVAVVRTASEGPAMFTGYIRDITERKQAAAAEAAIQSMHRERAAAAELLRAKDAAENANRELEAFSYSVAHDLRAPLRAINGFSSALLEDCGPTLDAEAQDYLHRIVGGADRMGQLIDALLGLSRVSRTELRRERVNLTQLAEAAIAQLRSADGERAVEFVAAPDLLARGDPQLLRVLFDNLLGNAWKFASKRALARIEFGAVEKDGARVYFVRDNGAGFDMTYAHKLFGPFQRLHVASEYAGTGIGLATVQRIVRRHGGKIWAEGVVDRGATFHFTLDPPQAGELREPVEDS